MKKIAPLSLSIINQVRLRRLVQGISARFLSLWLKHSEAYVSNIESSLNENQYPPHEWPKLAEMLKCTVHDLLPEGQSDSTEELVNKIVISLSNEQDVFLVLEGMIAFGFFAELRKLGEIEKHLFIEKAEQNDTLSKVLEALTSVGKLQSVNDGYLHQ